MESSTRPRRRALWLAVVLCALAAIIAAGFFVVLRMYPTLIRKHTVESRLNELGPAWLRIAPKLSEQGFQSTPQSLVIVAYKREKQMELFARGNDSSGNPVLRLVAQYPVLNASGTLGPKLREGDRQVPEGLYSLDSLNPNSRFHLALRVSYPSLEDVNQARTDGRDVQTLGSDIMIHGGSSSVGCLAMGDPAIEEIFLLAVLCNENVEIYLSPSKNPLAEINEQTPQWVADRYRTLASKLDELNRLSR